MAATPYTSTYRTCCGEGVGPIGPAGVAKQTPEKHALEIIRIVELLQPFLKKRQQQFQLGKEETKKKGKKIKLTDNRDESRITIN